MLHIQTKVVYPRQVFSDRFDAGRKLAAYLDGKPDPEAVVLAIPRGGIQVAVAVSDMLQAPIMPVFVRKLPIPSSPEAGFGAVAADGSTSINEEMRRYAGISDSEIEEIKTRVLAEVRRRAKAYAGTEEPPDVAGKNIYLVDDGLATGYTMVAAARMAAAGGPRTLTLAVPCSPADSLATVEPYFNDIYCLVSQEGPFFAVAAFYDDFTDLSDDEIRELLMRKGPWSAQRSARQA